MVIAHFSSKTPHAYILENNKPIIKKEDTKSLRRIWIGCCYSTDSKPSNPVVRPMGNRVTVACCGQVLESESSCSTGRIKEKESIICVHLLHLAAYLLHHRLPFVLLRLGEVLDSYRNDIPQKMRKTVF